MLQNYICDLDGKEESFDVTCLCKAVDYKSSKIVKSIIWKIKIKKNQ